MMESRLGDDLLVPNYGLYVILPADVRELVTDSFVKSARKEHDL